MHISIFQYIDNETHNETHDLTHNLTYNETHNEKDVIFYNVVLMVLMFCMVNKQTP